MFASSAVSKRLTRHRSCEISRAGFTSELLKPDPPCKVQESSPTGIDEDEEPIGHASAHECGANQSPSPVAAAASPRRFPGYTSDLSVSEMNS